jgi:ring-1,2-phenylacetyl-CoA epoxidase subunit PaaE
MLHFHSLEIVELRRETEDAVTLAFAVPGELRDEYRFVQGQHLALRVRLDGAELRRTYSLCGAAGEELLRIAIKRHAQGRFSTWANEQLKVGDRVDVLAPAGSFHTPLDPAAKPRLYIAFAAGSGITPVMSILKTTLATEPRSSFILYYGNRTTASIMFREELEDLKNRYMARLAVHHFLSREQRDLELYNGRLDAEKATELCRVIVPPQSVHAFFVCGPGTMIDDVTAALHAAGAPAERIHSERFTGATAVAAPSARVARPTDARCAVTVVLDGVSSEFEMGVGPEAGSILDAALARGLELPYSCKAGVCTMCRAKLMEGEVDFTANYGLEQYEVDEGIVLTCQSSPLSGRVLVDFDEAG